MLSRLRAFVFQVHAVVGLIAAVFVVAVASSGGILLFKEEIDRALRPNLFQARPSEERKSLSECVAKVEREFPSYKIRHVFPGQTKKDTVRIELTPGSWEVFVDPYSAEVLGKRDSERTFVGVVRRIHTTLLWQGGGKWVSSITGLALILLAASGMMLVRKRAFAILPVKGIPRLLRCFHTVAGVLLLPVVLVTVSTGIYLHFPAEVQKLLGSSPTKPTPISAALRSESGADACVESKIDIDTLCQMALKESGGGIVTRVALANPADRVVVRIRTPGDFHPNGMTFISILPDTGAITQKRTPEESGIVNKAIYWAFPAHTGAYGNGLGTVVQTIGAMGLTFLSASGTCLYGLRKFRSRGRKLRGGGG